MTSKGLSGVLGRTPGSVIAHGPSRHDDAGERDLGQRDYAGTGGVGLDASGGPCTLFRE
jgi:hypothetical protein